MENVSKEWLQAKFDGIDQKLNLTIKPIEERQARHSKILKDIEPDIADFKSFKSGHQTWHRERGQNKRWSWEMMLLVLIMLVQTFWSNLT